ncbi:hypothetical protein H8M03_05600 [Sphingomonas sabuli]|uniref:SGNH/GDSL hydrolase family protein n=1 Tax=Sphingomonas sabuli TaxID=2764186 RepID=A0A7G9L596_9SPHN|nr:hypothetical protein [Sphingomonas sabuli]QNM83795.1 hypothetical protein H8M03_05600 [Sphingomonas sabuli]
MWRRAGADTRARQVRILVKAALGSRKTTAPVRASSPAPAKPRTIILVGDSHASAVQRAIAKRTGKGYAVPLTAYRFQKAKRGQTLGDVAVDDLLERIAALGPDDVVISMIGGNQHAVFGSVQHPRRFDFFLPDDEAKHPAADAEIIPFRVLTDQFMTSLRTRDAKLLKAIREATKATIVHILPPPPKGDNAFIASYHEAHFADQGIGNLGVSDPQLRLKFWLLQNRMVTKLCQSLGITVLGPPRQTVDGGFLRRQYYADDVTHGNWHYGERILRQIERRFGAQASGAE